MTHVLHELLEASAATRPDAVAVVDGDRALTYAELNEQASRLANHLQSSGVVRGDRVGLYLQKSLEAIVGLYGIMKAGAAYVPIDPNAPAASRAAYIIENCTIGILVTSAEMADQWPDLPTATLRELVVLDVDEIDGPEVPFAATGRATIDKADPIYAPSGVIGQDLAYILYTSGSTGAPKGVKLSHLNALSYVRWIVDYFELTAEDRVANHPPLHFDMSIPDLYGAAWVGAPLYLVPAKASVFPIQIKRFIEGNEITVWYSVPSVLSMLLQRGKLEQGSMPSLRILTFAGEVFPSKFLKELMELVPHPRYINQYGPTETNVCTYYEVPRPPAPDSDIPIGRSITDVETFVVTEEGGRAAPGEVGELWVRGSTVMRGYWGDPEKTADRLVPDPFGGELPDLVYRTGDLVRENEEGDLDFLGRRDNQIKSRGYRIELGEIETAIYSHELVRECAVLPVPDDLVTNRIFAYVALDGEIESHELKGYLKDRLPPYMLPDVIEFAESLPKTSTGKIDRQALSAELPD
jgi:amino acid adenylation domain-containing protein